MASTRQLKSRIRSVGSTRQITKAMEMVAASHIEPVFWLIVVFTGQDVFSIFYGIFYLYIRTFITGICGRHEEWLR